MLKKELSSLLRIYRKSATSAQTDRRIATDEPLYTGTKNPHIPTSTQLYSLLLKYT